MEYFLRVWFTDGDLYEYKFLRSRPKDCYRISDNVLRIYLVDSEVAYSLDLVTSIQFGPREIPLNTPEVVEAEKIIAGVRKDD